VAGIKRTIADKWFSDCIRERANWTCEICHTYYPEGHRQGLHCSHFYSRGNWSIRFCVDNAFAHCFSCHNKFGGDPDFDTNDYYNSIFGEGMREILRQKKHDTGLGKLARKSVKPISKHYKKEYENMREKRMGGNIDRIEFVDYF